jgi:hypothetical protein
MLQVFNARQLSLLVGGKECVDTSTLLESIDWGAAQLHAGGFEGSASLVPTLLRELLANGDAFGPERRMQFFRWVTGRCAVPMGGLDNKIELRLEVGDETRLPRVQTCFNALYLPLYRSVDILKEKVTLALDHRDDGFHLQ